MNESIKAEIYNEINHCIIELVEHFNELQNNWPDAYAADHPIVETLNRLETINEKHFQPSIDPNTDPHCPFCFNSMQFTESNRFNDNEIKQHLTCRQCDCIVYIHQFI